METPERQVLNTDRNRVGDDRTQEELDRDFALTLAASQEDYYEYERNMFGGGATNLSAIRSGYAHVPYTSPGGTVATPKANPMNADLEAFGSIRDKQISSGVADHETFSTIVQSPSPIRDASRRDGGWFDDIGLARALQAMEFEIDEEMQRLEAFNDDFNNKEYRASSCRRQLTTISTLIACIQLLIVCIMLMTDGVAPSDVNPMIGPPPETMVIWGAKESALIKYSLELWRFISPIFLHAGIIHVVCNTFIQLRVGGYLNRVYGNWRWLSIYFLSGIFGNVCSCIFLPNSVGVGSSGAVLGMISSWIVWIVFRWRKIPSENKSRRNCQLLVVTASVVTTLALSFAPLVDFAAHFGGAVMGMLLAGIFFSWELENVTSRWAIIGTCISFLTAIVIWAIYYLARIWDPVDDRDLWGNN